MHSSGLTGLNKEKIKRSSGTGLLHVFRSDPEIYEGVPLIKIWLLRLLFTLMFLFLTFESWRHIWNHKGPWNDVNAAAWCMWGSYSVISFIGVMRPLKMLPIVIFEIIYKTAWLLIVAYPLWIRGELAGSPVEGMTLVFIWVFFPILAMPWRYFFRTFIWGKKSP